MADRIEEVFDSIFPEREWRRYESRIRAAVAEILREERKKLVVRCYKCHGTVIHKQTDEGVELFHLCPEGNRSNE